MIVVIDGEASVRTGMRTLLGDWHCQVLAVDSADAALRALEEGHRPPDAVVADYRLRDERTGIEAIESLRARFGADLPALIVTGDTAPDRLREAAASDLALLHKPFQPEQLRDFLLRSLRHPARKRRIVQP